ncbi:MAG: cupin domain-containing protein [Kangiellaceae bacterium]|nr:cupin domain-containing protein [Kangiellaceae bacterium]
MDKKLKKIVPFLVSVFSVWSLTAIAAEPHYTKTVKVEKVVQSSKSWNGNRLPTYPEGQPEVTLLKITIPPKTRLPIHKHTVINTGLLLSGELTVVSKKGENLKMKAGDPIVELVEEWHYGINETDENAVIVVFYAGVKGLPITIKENQKTD